MPDDDDPQEQSQEQVREQGRKKKQPKAKLSFELGKVFSPEAGFDGIGEEIGDLALDAARYKAAKGQAGTRTNPGSNNPDDYRFEDVQI